MVDHDRTDQVRHQAAVYDRQPSLWPANTRTAPPRGTVLRRAGTAARVFGTVAALVVGIPWLLWAVFGNPLSRVPSWSAIEATLDRATGVPRSALVAAAIWAGWLCWAAIAVLVLGSVLSEIGGRRLPRLRLPAPLHRLLFGLTGTAAIALVSTPNLVAVVADAPSQTSAIPRFNGGSGADRGDALQPEDRAPAVLLVGETRFEYLVRRGDTLSKIAKVWLADADRWPDICRLNKHRHFPQGGTLTDCDLIFPGWELQLPKDAVAPPPAKPVPHKPRPRPVPSPVPTEELSPPVRETVPAAPTPSTTDHEDETSAGRDLVLPGGSVIPWLLAAGISAAAALVWRQRRRRYVPNSAEPVRELLAPVQAAQKHAHDSPPPKPSTEETREFALPAGGVGLVGPGADDAARGLIVTALTTRHPADDNGPEVIIDQAAMTDLLGDDVLPQWSRLRVTADPRRSLNLLETQLLQRARILDEDSTTDLDTQTVTAPDDQAFAPLLLITRAETAIPSGLAQTVFDRTRGLGVTVVVMGAWPPGPTIAVSTDGTITAEDPTVHAHVGGRVAVLDIATAVDLLTTIREAHTGEPPVSERLAPRPAPAPETAALAALDEPATLEPASHIVQLRVLGAPRIDAITRPGRPLRNKAAELAVYLACHPEGADTDSLADQLLPDARVRQAAQQVHTNASNLRHVLGRAGDPDKGGYLIKGGPDGKYRLNPDTVEVDLWQLRELVNRARLTSPADRAGLLTEACGLYTAPLADGCDYDWIEPHREQARRWIIDAREMLTRDLLSTDPRAAAKVIDEAIVIDPYNEELYRLAMRTRHALGDADGIRTLYRALAHALSDLDAEPDETTQQLSAQLQDQIGEDSVARSRSSPTEGRCRD